MLNPKSQIPNKSQFQILNEQNDSSKFRILVIGICLEFGAWYLVLSLFHHVLKGLQPGGQSFPSCMFIKGKNEKGGGGPSPDFQTSFDEFLKEGINAAFKGSQENHAIHSTR
jgi:hypothetical protein